MRLQQRAKGSPSRTPMGAPAAEWLDVPPPLWARVRPLSGRELFLAQQAASRVDVEVKIRYRPGVHADMRVVHGATVYAIETVIDPEEKHEWLFLRCVRGVRPG